MNGYNKMEDVAEVSIGLALFSKVPISSKSSSSSTTELRERGSKTTWCIHEGQ